MRAHRDHGPEALKSGFNESMAIVGRPVFGGGGGGPLVVHITMQLRDHLVSSAGVENKFTW